MPRPAWTLLRNPDFQKLWLGQTVSEFGSTVTREALPYAAVLALGATPAQMGLLAAAGAAPTLVVSLFAGAWTDRLKRRPLMLAADLARAALLATIPLAALADRLAMPQLFAVAVLVGGLSVLFDVAYAAYLPSLVTRDGLADANRVLGWSGSLVETSAPGAAGVLVQALTAPLAIVVDALSFLWSAALLATIARPELAPVLPARRYLGREIAEGGRALLGQPLLRAFALDDGTRAFFAALYALYALRTLGLGAALLGLTVTLGGVGELAGAALSEPLARRYGVGRTILGASAVGSVVSLLIPLAHGSVAVAAGMLILAQFFGDGSAAVAAIHTTTVRQSITPDRLRGRVAATAKLIGEGAAPLGALAGGAIAGGLGVRSAIFIAVAGGALGLAWLICSPLGALRSLPATPPLDAEGADAVTATFRA